MSAELGIREILKLVVDKYGNCKSYQDAGVVQGSMVNSQFRTYFERPSKFSFEFKYSDQPTYGAIWCDGSNEFLSYDNFLFKEKTHIDASLPFGAAVGATNGLVALVGNLLMPNRLTLRKLSDMKTAEVAEVLESGEKFYKIVETSGVRIETLWIRASDFAITKYKMDDKLGGGEVSDEIFKRLSETISNKSMMDSLSESGLPNEMISMIKMVAEHPEMLDMLKEMNKFMPKEMLEHSTTATLENVRFDQEIEAKHFLQPPWKGQKQSPW